MPHIPNPFDFLDSILELNSDSRVLIEFQRREFIIGKNMWTQISHDHVNIFSIGDFAERFEILDSGEFANSEWAYVLLKKGTTINSNVDCFSEFIEFEKVFRVRDFEIESLAELKSPIAIYGAAGKGIVFGFSLMNSKFAGGGIVAIDSDINRHNRFMECSGIKVISPTEALNFLAQNTTIVLMNSSHYDYVSKIFAGKFKILTIGNIDLQ